MRAWNSANSNSTGPCQLELLATCTLPASRSQEPSAEELGGQLSSTLSHLTTPESQEQLAETSNTPGQRLTWQLAAELLPWALGSSEALPEQHVAALLRIEVVLVQQLLGVLAEGEADQLLAAVCSVLPRLAKRPDGGCDCRGCGAPAHPSMMHTGPRTAWLGFFWCAGAYCKFSCFGPCLPYSAGIHVAGNHAGVLLL